MSGDRTSEMSNGIRVIIVMGVAGAGKTVVGRELAQVIGWEFHDADDYHSKENIEKMHRGEGLTDADRQPWLEALRRLISSVVRDRGCAVLACSALKQAYRDMLVPDEIPPDTIRFVFLNVPREELERRLEHRHHFAGPSLLSSQLETLEPPTTALWIDGMRPISAEVQAIRDGLGV